MKEKVVSKARELNGKGQQVKIGYNKVTSEKKEWHWPEKESRWFRKSRTKREGGTKLA